MAATKAARPKPAPTKKPKPEPLHPAAALALIQRARNARKSK